MSVCSIKLSSFVSALFNHYKKKKLTVAAIGSEEENDPPTYKDAFPPLPEKAVGSETPSEPAGAWSKIRPIKSSVITQVG